MRTNITCEDLFRKNTAAKTSSSLQSGRTQDLSEGQHDDLHHLRGLLPEDHGHPQQDKSNHCEHCQEQTLREVAVQKCIHSMTHKLQEASMPISISSRQSMAIYKTSQTTANSDNTSSYAPVMPRSIKTPVPEVSNPPEGITRHHPSPNFRSVCRPASQPLCCYSFIAGQFK
jgi:hypothetical protein